MAKKKEVTTTTATVEITIIGNKELTAEEIKKLFIDISDDAVVKNVKNFVMGDLNHGRYLSRG